MELSKRARERQDDDSFLEPREAARLAGIQQRRLARWMKIGVVTPTRRLVSPSRAILNQGFSLGDVGYLHLLHHLRDRGVALRVAVEVLYHLMARFGPPGEKWREATLLVDGRRRIVAYAPDEWEATVPIPGSEGAGQRLALEILADIIPPSITIESLLIPSEFLRYVEISASKENGRPVVRGTRLHTSMIRTLVDKMGAGTVVRDYYDHITEEAAVAAKEFEEYLDRVA